MSDSSVRGHDRTTTCGISFGSSSFSSSISMVSGQLPSSMISSWSSVLKAELNNDYKVSKVKLKTTPVHQIISNFQ